jgi:hypothetical protein
MNESKAKSALDMVFLMSEAIREAGSIPSGHLYAMVLGQLTMEQYTRVIGILEGAGLVRETANVLTWVGPQIAAVAS